MAAHDVLMNIARCAGGNPPRPPFPECAAVVAEQDARGPDEFQVPEPWRGDLVNAPLLFVSSNPGFDRNDDCPTAAVAEQSIVDYYMTGFSPEFPKNRNRAGQPSARAVQFWSEMRRRAGEIYGRPADSLRAGIDFALTEVVHCKSKTEAVAVSAVARCVSRHFDRIATISHARVVVIFGDVAAAALSVPNCAAVESRVWHGRDRLIMWLPHPNARKRRTVRGLYSPNAIAQMNTALA